MKNQAVCITGMHRSGTSMVARLLNLCGLYLGKNADLIPPNPTNPAGHWENRHLVALNDELLGGMGATWNSPPRVQSRRRKRASKGMKKEAAKLLEGLRRGGIWGWKDPRNCLTLDFWAQMVPGLKVVICLRNPLEVAESLARRDGFPIKRGLKLWYAYNRHLLNAASPERRVISHYDSYFAEPEQALRRVLRFLQRRTTQRMIRDLCAQVVVPELRHSRRPLSGLRGAGAPRQMIDLYERMCEEAQWHEERRRPGPAPSLKGKAPREPAGSGVRHRRGPPDRHGDNPVRAAGRKIRKERLEARLEQQAELIQRLITTTAENRAEIKEARTRIDELRSRFGSLEESVVRRHTSIGRHLERQGERLDDLDQRLQGHGEQVKRLGGVVARLGEEAGRERELLWEGLYDLESKAAASMGSGDWGGQSPEHRGLLGRLREAVRSFVPGGAKVLVISKGDHEMTRLFGRQAGHFPQDANGLYLGYHPRDSAAAIVHLEYMRAMGADYLLVPETTRWWLDHYGAFGEHLRSCYSAVMDEGGTGALFDLHTVARAKRRGWGDQFRELIRRCKEVTDQDPSILDWDTNYGLAERFPDAAIFSPYDGSPQLPYLDESVDVVVIPSAEENRLAEAGRVARAATVQIPVLTLQEPGEELLEVHWKIPTRDDRLAGVSILLSAAQGGGSVRRTLRWLRETLPESFEGEILCPVEDEGRLSFQLTAEESAWLEPRIRVLIADRYAGSAGLSRMGMHEAKRGTLIFLAGKALLMHGWLHPLLRVLRDRSDAGAVGCKVVMPDGRLAQAGCRLASGGLMPIGRGEVEVDSPLYGYLKAVDCCTGPVLVTPGSVFRKLNGFDEGFEAGSYQFADYSLRLSAKGWKTYCQPESVAVDFGDAIWRGEEGGDVDAPGEEKDEDRFASKWRFSSGEGDVLSPDSPQEGIERIEAGRGMTP